MNGESLDAAEDEKFDDAFDRLFAIAYRSAFRVLGSREDAEDAAIETLARASVRWKKLLPLPDPWVSRVAANLSIDRWRRQQTEGEHRRGLDRHSTPGTEDLRMDLARGLSRLPRRQRETIVLRFFADLTKAQTAAALGVTVGTVKKSTARALARLRSELGEDFAADFTL